MINLQKLAENVTRAEGGKVNLSIAQVKEVIKLTLLELWNYEGLEVLQAIERTRRRHK